MPDIRNVAFGSATSRYTTMTVTGYSFTPKPTERKTVGSINIRISMSSGSWVGTHSWDKTYGRQVVGKVNGHSIGVHLIKPYNTVYWYKGGTYDYTLNFEIPYSPGTVSIYLQVQRQSSGADGTACFTVPGGYTVSSGRGSVPNAPGAPTFNGTGGVFVTANLSGTYTLAWPAVSGAVSYHTYYNAGRGWVHMVTTAARSHGVNIGTISVGRGTTVRFGVAANGVYGSSGVTAGGSFKYANAPSAPTSVSTPSESKYNTSLRVSWSGASAGEGSIKQYRVQVRRLSAGRWSSWANVGYTTSGYIDTTPSAYTAWSVRPGDVLQYRVATANTYGLWSGYREGGTTLMKGGIIRVNIGGAWKEGTVWINVGGVWKEANSVYINAGGVWKESL